MVNVLVGCETSGKVREAFRARGHNAWSCDILPADDASPYHIQCDVRVLLKLFHWDIGIFHPPCTYLCNSGVRWLHERPERWPLMHEAAALFLACLNAPIESVAVENPVMHKYAREIVGRGPNFTVQPWQFGHGEVKRTCFWTRKLPALVPTSIVTGREARVHRMAPSKIRWKHRSETFQGIADAMGAQWG